MPVTITLTKGYCAVVDDEDAHLARKHWHAVVTMSGKVYAASSFGGPNNARVRRKLHQAIMNAPIGLVVDHIDGDTMNNRRSNLRVVTQAVNLRNRKYDWGMGYRYDHENGRWFVRICWERKPLFLGRTNTEDEAKEAVATARAALERGDDPSVVMEAARALATRRRRRSIAFLTPEEAEAAKAKSA